MKKNSCIYGLTALIVIATAAWLVLFSTGCTMFGKKLTQLEKNSGVQYKNAVGYAGEQASKAFVLLSGKFPVYSEGSKWEDSELGSWAEGYYPGMVWFLYQTKKDTLYYRLARQWLERLANRKNDTSSFGLGQVFYPTFVIGYQITGNRTFRELALEAAQSISSRFNKAGFFPAWGEPGDTVLTRRLSVESMMDLEFLYWAAEASGNRKYANQADQHAFFTMLRLLNNDGRVLHVADFNPTTGEPYLQKTPELADDKKYSPKGYSPSSVWALGQAWAIYGFTTAYQHSSRTVFLNAARLSADYFIDHLPEDGIPLWDFELPPNEPRAKDSSAGAVAAAALLKLSRIYPGGPEKKRFHEAAMKIITSLNQDYFGRTEVPGVLSGGLFNKNMSLGIGGSTSWGDYYFIEALLLLQDTRS